MPLHEDQLEILGEKLVPLFQKLETAVIADIARRLKKTKALTETAENMARALRSKGFSPAEIHAEVMRTINADKAAKAEITENTIAAKRFIQQKIIELRKQVDPAIKDALSEAADMAFQNDLSAWKGPRLPIKGSAFEQLVKAMQERACDEILNLTKTTGFRFQSGLVVRQQQAYTNALNIAFTKITSGAYSYQQALEEAVRQMARSGLRMINFESGVSRQLDTAARNAMLTASAQLSGQITMQNVEDTGVELVEVSKHWGARTGKGHGNHAAWQGRIYRVKGSDDKYANLESVTGYPSDPTGLLGYNCRHTFYPFWEGVSKPNKWDDEPPPVEINGKTYTYYQVTQEQRRMEREIRAMKREEIGYREAELFAKAKYTKSRINGMIREYNEFSRRAGISPKPTRLRVATITK